jgi:hypothetical protein
VSSALHDYVHMCLYMCCCAIPDVMPVKLCRTLPGGMQDASRLHGAIIGLGDPGIRLVQDDLANTSGYLPVQQKARGSGQEEAGAGQG